MLNVVLIPGFGIVGAAWATIVTEGIRSILALVYVRRLGYPSLPARRLLVVGVAALAMGLAVVACSALDVWLRIVVGFFFYALILTLLGGLRIRGGFRLQV